MDKKKWTKYHWTLPIEVEKKLDAIASEKTMSRAYVLRELVEKEYAKIDTEVKETQPQ